MGPRSKFPEVLTGVLLTLAVLSVGLVIGSSPYTRQTTQQQTAEETSGESRKEQPPEAFTWSWFTAGADGFFQTMLFVVGGLQLALFYVQLRLIRESMSDARAVAEASRESAETAKTQVTITQQQLRAYMLPAASELVDASAIPPGHGRHPNEPGAVFSWKNSGQTPALKSACWGRITVIPVDQEHTLVVPNVERDYFLTLGAGAAGTRGLWLGRSLTPQEVADINAHKLAIYIYGRLEYEDIFGKTHFTNFRLDYPGPYPPPLGRGLFRACDEGNESN